MIYKYNIDKNRYLDKNFSNYPILKYYFLSKNFQIKF